MTCGKIDLNTGDLAYGVSGKDHLEQWGFSDGFHSPGKGRGFRAYLQAPVGPKDSYYAYLQAQGSRARASRRRGLRAPLRPDRRSRRVRATPSQQQGGRRQGSDQQWRDTDASPVSDRDYGDNWIARNGLSLLERAPKGSPWLLYVNFAGPHPPMDITASMERRYRGPDRVIDGFPQPHDYRGTDRARAPPAHPPELRGDDREHRSLDRASTSTRSSGAASSTTTIIVYSSDHGEMLGDHGRWGKSVPFHPSANVPLYVAGPGVRAGHRSDALVSLMDLSATFLDYGGVEVPESMDSRSIRPVLEGKTEKHRDYVLSGLRDWRLAWDGRYKYITGFGEGGDLAFDLAEDPLEDRNLAAAAPKAALRMRDVLRSRRRRETLSSASARSTPPRPARRRRPDPERARPRLRAVELRDAHIVIVTVARLAEVGEGEIAIERAADVDHLELQPVHVPVDRQLVLEP